jgi:hypothetical protein
MKVSTLKKTTKLGSVLACVAVLLGPCSAGAADADAQRVGFDALYRESVSAILKEADKTSPAKPGATFNVKDFGAAGDGKTLDTAAITQAIRAANAAGGGRVVFSTGTYLTGTFELLSNVTLDLEADATILGSKNLADYASIRLYGFGMTLGVDATGDTSSRLGIIVARKADNIAIVGSGVIDGSGDDFFDFSKPHYGRGDFDPKYTRQSQDFMKSMEDLGDGPVDMKPAGRPGTLVVFAESRNVRVSGVTFRNSPNWTFHLDRVQDLEVSGLRVENNQLIPNNDGIDCTYCKDARFSNLDIRTGDDALSIYSSEGVVVTDSSLASRSSAIRLEATQNATFTGLTVDSNRGIGIYERGGTTAHVRFSDVSVRTHLFSGHWWGKAEPIFIAVADGRAPVVSDVSFTDVVGEVEGGIIAYGNEKSPLRDVVFERVKLTVRAPRPRVSAEAGGNFDFRWTATELAKAIFAHDIPALYARYVDGLDVRGLSVDWAADVPAYFSNAIECEDFQRLNVDGFYGRQAPTNAAKEAVALRRGRDATIQNSKAAPGTGIFLSSDELTGKKLFSGNDLRGSERAFPDDKTGFTLSGNLMPTKN